MEQRKQQTDQLSQRYDIFKWIYQMDKSHGIEFFADHFGSTLNEICLVWDQFYIH